MKRRVLSAVLALGVMLAGCATKPQAPVAMNSNDWAQGGRIGVVMSTLPKPDTYLPGASCLLCIGVAALANSSLTTHAKTLSTEELVALKADVAAQLRKKGADVVVFDDNVNVGTLAKASNENGPSKDFAALKSKYPVERLLVIQVDELGYLRTYSAYVPTSDPKGYVKAQGFIVNMSNNQYQWYMPVQVVRASEQAWDEAPSFPGLTNAYYQAVEAAKDQVLTALKQ